jgi:hypothetical protein
MLLASICECADISRVYFQRAGETKLLICLEALNGALSPNCYLVLDRGYRGYRVHADDVYAKDRQDFEALAADRGQYSQTVKL